MSYEEGQWKLAEQCVENAKAALDRALRGYEAGHTQYFRAALRRAAEHEAAFRRCRYRAVGNLQEARCQVPGVVERADREAKYKELKDVASRSGEPIINDMVSEIDIYEENEGFD